MKRIHFLAVLTSLNLLFFTSCIDDDVLNGVVQIEMVSTPEPESISEFNQPESIKIKFSTHTEIEEVSVILFKEDPQYFTIEGGKVKLKEDVCLKPIPDNPEEDTVMEYENLTINDKEFVFEEQIDLSIYPDGTCFVLYGKANGVSEVSEGYDLKGIYFCKDEVVN